MQQSDCTIIMSLESRAGRSRAKGSDNTAWVQRERGYRHHNSMLHWSWGKFKRIYTRLGILQIYFQLHHYGLDPVLGVSAGVKSSWSITTKLCMRIYSILPVCIYITMIQLYLLPEQSNE